MIHLHHGDCLTVLDTLEENSIDAILTDPPYNLSEIANGKSGGYIRTDADRAIRQKGFMGKAWDNQIAFDPETWVKALQVLKPGGHMLAFGSSRTHHRMMVAIEDAGFEIRDVLMWVYGSGFAKSLNLKRYETCECGGNSFGALDDGALPGRGQCPRCGKLKKEYEAFGTALKPAYEPIILCRKPLSEKTVAKNVLKHGTGGLNIDAARIMTTDQEIASRPVVGRWPANFLHNSSDEVLELFPQSKSTVGSAARFFYSPKASKSDRANSRHPTVKPVKLLEYLMKLITPPDGTVLDLFAGSGTTGEAARNLGFDCVLIEKEDEYFADIERRFNMLVA